jgi:GNAT superfamily N-acetyltransferase
MIHDLVEGGATPGLLGYLDSAPVGWISLAPRPEYTRLETSRSPVYQRLDGAPVWSVVCFFIDRRHRRKGIGLRLLQAGIDFARAHGATMLEAYPVEVEGRVSAANVYVGVPSLFAGAGFVEVARPKADRPVMRLVLEGGAA